MHARRADCLVLTLILALPTFSLGGLRAAPVRAQALADPTPGATEGGTHAGTHADQADGETPRVAFLLPDLDSTTLAQLNEALLAQLSLVHAQLIVRQEPLSLTDAPMSARMEAAQALADQEGARIVMWLETEREGRWLLHILDAKQQRVIVRPLDARDAQRPAAIEAVGVLAREASRAVFIEKTALAPEPVAKVEVKEPANVAPPAAPSAPPAKPSRAGPWRLALSYVASDFAPEVPIRHGVAAGARFELSRKLFVGLGAALVQSAEPRAAPFTVPFAVRRIPFNAHGGYRFSALTDLWMDAELGLCIDVLDREASAQAIEQAPNTQATASEDTTRVTAAVCPRARAEYKPLQTLGFFLDLGLDLLLTNLRYEAQQVAPGAEPDGQDLLRPYWIRPAFEAGIAVYP